MSSSSIIPRPVAVEPIPGLFELSGATALQSVSDASEPAALWFQERFYQLSGVCLAVTRHESASSIRLVEQAGLGAEGYSLNIAPGTVEIKASAPSGFLYALVSLLQSVPLATLNSPAAPGTWRVPCRQIDDAPRFGWRGLMLDSSRYFQPVAWIKKFLDLMLLHKLNVFHWHLTDDQGWRAEIERYPELTTVSAWRRESRVGHERDAAPSEMDGKPHGGFYSKAQMREIVAYAAARGITVIPEIEMPGHVQEVLAAYPHLGCTGRRMEVSTRWGVHQEAFCAGNDEVLRFLEGVLEEILDIFPSEFIHVGGDECLTIRWKDCPKCQRRVRDEALQDEHELQAWFVRHFDTFLRDRGRRLIGWDEILEGGLAQTATVMSWRGEEGGIAAAHKGHDAVMAPHQYVYLDYYQSSNRHSEPLAIDNELLLKKVYLYEPIPSSLSETEARHILGAQGAIWTEYMPRTDRIEYMTFPRACALAERLWSPRPARDYNDFIARLTPHLGLLDRLQVNYRAPRARDLV